MLTLIVLLICLILIWFIWAMSDAAVSGNSFLFGKIDLQIEYTDNKDVWHTESDEGSTGAEDHSMFNDAIIASTAGITPLKYVGGLHDGEIYAVTTSAHTLKREFKVINSGNVPVYYRVYFDLDKDFGNMSNAVRVTIRDKDTGEALRETATVSQMKQAALDQSADSGRLGEIDVGEVKNLVMELSLPFYEPGNPDGEYPIYTERDSEGNVITGPSIEFDLCVEAVQIKYNEVENGGGSFN